MPQLPIPPMPVMPDTGPVPLQRDPTTAENAEMSPTAMIQNYLAQRGYQPTAENVSRAMQANARDPGVISGLRSDVPATNAQDLAAMAAAKGGGGRPQNNTPVNAANTSLAQGEVPPPGYTGNTAVNAINTSVQPGDRPRGTGNAGPEEAELFGNPLAAIATALGLGGAGGGALAAPKIAEWIRSGSLIPRDASGAVVTPPPVATAPPAAPRPGVGSRIMQGFAAPLDQSLAKATEGAPVVEGVGKVNPDLLPDRRKGPTQSVEGAKAPEVRFRNPESRVYGPPAAPEIQGPPAPPPPKGVIRSRPKVRLKGG